MTSFFNVTPQAQSEATRIPVTLLDTLLHQRPDWTSPNWRKMFLSSWLSPCDLKVIQVREIQISAFLSRGRSAASAVDRTSTLHVCRPPGCGIAGVSDTQVLSLSHPSSQHHRVTPLNQGHSRCRSMVLRGVRRNPKPAKPRLPITPEILRHLKNQWAPPMPGRQTTRCYGQPVVWFLGVLEGRGVHNKAWRTSHTLTAGRGC
jgi:hypothetical protein